MLDGIHLEEDASSLRFGNSEMLLEFSRRSGAWTSLRDRRGPAALAGGGPTLLLTVGGRMRHTPAFRVDELTGGGTVGRRTRYAGHTVRSEAGAAVLELTAAEGDWRITSIFHLQPQSGLLRRDLRLEYGGAEEELLREAELLLPALTPVDPSHLVIEAPGYPVPPHFPFTELAEGDWPGLSCWSFAGVEGVSHAMDAPGSMPGLIAVHDPVGRWSVACWPFSRHEPAWAVVRRRGGAVVMAHRLQMADRFPPGHVLEGGSQCVRLSRGSWDEALERHERWYPGACIRTPVDGPTWAREAAIYEVHVGKAPFPEGRDYEPYPTVEDLRQDLARINSLGFEVIQLMPHWPYPGYSVDDLRNIDVTYGSERELRRLAADAHGLGMRIILDVVLHGCLDREIVRWDQAQFGSRHALFALWLELARERSPYRDEHPEWFQREEDGSMARVYTWAFDPANRSFQDYVIQVAGEYGDRLGIDGFRFDAPTWNTFPNWDRGLPYRASASLYGAYELFVRMREAFRRQGRELLIFTEPGGPLFRACTDLTYNYDEEWISGSLMRVVSPRGYAGAGVYDGTRLDAARLAEWLRHRSLALPPGEATAHHLDSHDTFWWGGKAQFRREAFGRPAARVLFAFFALIGGAVMVYTGAERGDEDFYRRLLELRHSTPVLRRGACRFAAAGGPAPGVLAVLRSWEERRALVLLNFAAEEAGIILPPPAGDWPDAFRLPGRGPVRDLLDPCFAAARQSGAPLVVAMPPYGVRILSAEQSRA